MIIGAFLFYLVVFLILFTSKEKFKAQSLWRILILPGFLALVFALVGAIKIYFIYKILLLLVVGILSLLSYWQWKDQWKRWLP